LALETKTYFRKDFISREQFLDAIEFYVELIANNKFKKNKNKIDIREIERKINTEFPANFALRDYQDGALPGADCPKENCPEDYVGYQVQAVVSGVHFWHRYIEYVAFISLEDRMEYSAADELIRLIEKLNPKFANSIRENPLSDNSIILWWCKKPAHVSNLLEFSLAIITISNPFGMFCPHTESYHLNEVLIPEVELI
jgi:hypothetical protein